MIAGPADLTAKTPSQAADPARCPLCHGANQCPMVTGQRGEGRCWCSSASIPQELLERIPAEQRRKACVCQRCVEEYRREEWPPSLGAILAGRLYRVRRDR